MLVTEDGQHQELSADGDDKGVGADLPDQIPGDRCVQPDIHRQTARTLSAIWSAVAGQIGLEVGVVGVGEAAQPAGRLTAEPPDGPGSQAVTAA